MLKDLLFKARSIRSFDMSKPIDTNTLTEFIDCLRYTPSSCNFQALKYLLINDCENCTFMRNNTRWAAFLPDYNGPCADKSPMAYIVICQDINCCENETLYLKDVGIAAQTLNLLAREKEIGCCMIGSFDINAVKDHFKLADNIKPKLVLALGYPLEEPIIEDEKGNVKYYRDENNVHHVPKRLTKDLII